MKRLRTALIWPSIIVLSVGLAALVIYIAVAYVTGVFPDPDWTGFGPPKVNSDWTVIPTSKTLWDWLGLLLVPGVLAVGGYLFTQAENEQARKVEGERAQDAALQAYLDQMTSLLLHENLLTSQPDDVVRSVARARTLAVLQGLSGLRRATVIHFLSEAKLIGGLKQEADGTLGVIDVTVSLREAALDSIELMGVDLAGADLEAADLKAADLKAANLSRASLFNANLSMSNLLGADLSEAVLTIANLRSANLVGAYLVHSDLTGADLRGAHLDGANLSYSNVTREQLLQAASLEGAILPFDMTSPPAPPVEEAAPQDGQSQPPALAAEEAPPQPPAVEVAQGEAGTKTK